MQVALPKTYSGRSFSLRWFLSTLASHILSLVLMMAGLGKAINHWQLSYFGAVVGGVFGLMSGMIQSLLLRKYIPHIIGWCAATCTGWILFWSLNMAGVFDHGDGLPGKIWEGIVHGALFGCILGLLQSLCFSYRRQSVQWLLSSIILWSFSAAVADSVRTLLYWNGPVEFMIALPLSALLSGISMSDVLRNKVRP